MSENPKYVFIPKARLMVLLGGNQLIKNHTLALFELVKNAYDADANMINVTLLDVDKLGGMIVIYILPVNMMAKLVLISG